MNKQNLLSRAEMKKVMGGYEMLEERSIGGGACSGERYNNPNLCFNCCLAWADTQPNPPHDPGGLEHCASYCNRF